MLKAIKYIKPIKTGRSLPHILECNDGKQYVVKFDYNERASKRLAHEFIAYKLAKYLGLPIAEGQIIYLGTEVTEIIKPDNINLGPHFGCVYYKNAQSTNKELIQKCINLNEMPGVIVFDHWVHNDRAGYNDNLIIDEGEQYNKLYMIDQGGSFYSSKRNSKTLRESAEDMEVYWGELYQVFKPFLQEKNLFYKYIKAIEEFPDKEIKKIVYSTPPEWESDHNELDAIVDYLIIRKKKVKEPIRKILKMHLNQ
ncbi:HipA family kinase [Bacillus sp. FJAT-27251]|uniref:HipA family kinase n=1 Tax=Bacillus sp. FJAT-27251 TaxID=1684142 RepID=UPI0012E2AFB1|nr:HipA family kinase [Bacillus sp. FJAT-27251]